MRERAERHSLAAASAAVIVVAALLAPIAVGNAAAWTRSSVRVAGDDRYATAVSLTQIVFPKGASTVLVASGEGYPDALAGGAAAGTNHAPLLLTGATTLPDVVSAELRRLAPNKVRVLGGPSAVSDAVVAQIAAATGVTPTRVAGATRYDTAAAIAAWFPPGGTAFVATGDGFADGLAGGPAAGTTTSPVLLSERETLPASTSAQLQRLRPSRILVLGGTGVISDAVLGALSAFSSSVRRIAGADRYGTAAAIAQEFFPHPTETWLASGVAFPDALAAGAAAAVFGAPLLLSLPACVPPITTASLQVQEWPNVTVIGGVAALSDAVEAVSPCSPLPDGDLGPGVRLDTFVIDGPNVVRMITIDRKQGLDIRSSLATGRLVGRIPTSEIARRWNAIVAVNGDFFEGDGRPSHAFATDGRMLRMPALVEDQVGFSAADPGVSYLGTPNFAMTAKVQETAATSTIQRSNDGEPGPDELAMFTPEGVGSASSPPAGACVARLAPAAPATLDATGNATQVHTVVAKVCGGPAPVLGSDDVLVASATGSRASFIMSLSASQHVTIGWRVHPQWPDLLDATGSNTTLVHNSAPSEDVVFGSGPFYDITAPRTAVGRMSDGRDVLVTVDGRQPGYSVGMTPMEFAQFLVSKGVTEATNLDGGGSTTLSVGGLLVNRPSDPAGERAVGNALVVVPSGTPDPPPFVGAASAPPPGPDAVVATDSASLGGYAATLAARRAPLTPELAAIARVFNQSGR